jgi:type II secretory pathway predicted ATPase ExeA
MAMAECGVGEERRAKRNRVMYEAFFGLNDRPFAPAPLARRYFPAGPAEAARQTLARCIDRGEGIGLLIGPAGTGKTLLCQVLAEQFRARFAIALLSSGRICTRRNLFQAILFELGLPYRGMEEGELRLALVDHLTNEETHQGGLLLLVDEAHLLPLRLLEEVRLLTNLLRSGQPRVRLLLSSGAVLEERMASPKLESFNQRIAARCYLQAFNHDETLAYVRSEIVGAAGHVEQIFTGDALHAIHRATDGIPRLVNQVCDHALVLAYAGGVRQIGQAGIEEAWADLQQLPTPWNATTGATDQSPDIIEFGALEEDVLPIKVATEKAAQPRLHAISDDDESDLFFGEPAERIEKIEATIDAIDSDYEPATTKTPEVELVFADPDDPFAEQFVEEEVVVDRFAELESGLLANRPLVRSAEGRELSALLDFFRDSSGGADIEGEAPPAWTVPDEFEPTEGDPLDSDDETIAAESGRSTLRPAEDPVLPEESSTISISIGSAPNDLSLSSSAAFADSGSETEYDEFGPRKPDDDATDLDAAASLEAPLDEDQDLIVVEDDPPDPVPPNPSPPKVRRQEYRQLFARLRRG